MSDKRAARLLNDIAKQMAEAASGLVVAEHVTECRKGWSTGRLEHFRKLHPAHAKDRQYTMDGNDRDVFIKVEPKSDLHAVSYYFPGKTEVSYRSSFVPCTQGPVIVVQGPRDDAWFWRGQKFQNAVNEIAKRKEYILPESRPTIGQRVGKLLGKKLG